MATHLSPDELHELWAELRLELRRLGGRPPLFQDENGNEAAELQAAASAAAHEGAGSGRSGGSPETDSAMRAAWAGRVPERFLRLLDALSRMRSGTYGTCVACRRPIPFARLTAIPEATSCIECSGGGRHASREGP